MGSRSGWRAALAVVVWMARAVPADAGSAEGYALSFGGAFLVGQPLGDFADQVGSPYGLGGHMTWARPGRAFGLRLEATGLVYGSDTRRVPVGLMGLRQSVDVVTTNGMATLGLGPQFVLPHGSIRPYLTAFGGLSYFSTDSSVQATRDFLPVAQSTNYDDTVVAYGAGIGILVPLRSGKEGGWALDLGARFVAGGQVRYLAEGDLTDLPGGGVSFVPRRTASNRFEFHIGVAAIP
jgi:hypothetical protein